MYTESAKGEGEEAGSQQQQVLLLDEECERKCKCKWVYNEG